MKLSDFSKNFWWLNSVQMTERLAYWLVVLQMPIYIAQKDTAGGLGWTHIEKGVIYFWWALFQNLTPLISGYFADRFGRKTVINFSVFIAITGFIGMSFSNTFYFFLLFSILLGIGLGAMKPAIQGSIATELNSSNSYHGWSIYVFLVNLSVFLAPPISIYLKNTGWQYLFWASALLMVIIWLLLLFIKNTVEKVETIQINIKQNIKMFIEPRVVYFIILMTGFTTIYMQFYETLPNFMYDWVDTSNVASFLGLPSFMLMETPLNKGLISYEWLYNINTGLIILFVIPMTYLFRKFATLKTIATGILITCIGLALCGLFQYGFIVIIGFIVYTFGEMTVNPKFTQYLGDISSNSNASTYLSYMNVSWAIGLAGSGYLGGWLYHTYSEKAMLAKRFLIEELKFSDKIDLKNSFTILQNHLNTDAIATTNLLYEKYNPQMIWYIFLGIGVVSTIGLIILSKKVNSNIK